MSAAIDLTREILAEYSPYSHPDDEVCEALYWAEAKWAACRASIEELLHKAHDWDPVPVEWLAWDASVMIEDPIPCYVFVKADGSVAVPGTTEDGR